MQHLDEGTIHSWLDGALSADEAARVEAHVKECPQCAAAVAEARGFIAASSRILTALDNAPRGVIPAAAPAKRVDPMVWRIAATVLVVAAGTLAVFRNGVGTAKRDQAATVQTAATASSPVAPETLMRDEPARQARRRDQLSHKPSPVPRQQQHVLSRSRQRWRNVAQLAKLQPATRRRDPETYLLLRQSLRPPPKPSRKPWVALRWMPRMSSRRLSKSSERRGPLEQR